MGNFRFNLRIFAIRRENVGRSAASRGPSSTRSTSVAVAWVSRARRIVGSSPGAVDTTEWRLVQED